MPITRRSPVQRLLESQGAELRDFGGGCFAVRVHSEAEEAHAKETLGLCDVSGLQKLGLKGDDAATWLHSLGIDVPGEILAANSLPQGGKIVRFGQREFFLEDGIANKSLPKLLPKADSHRGALVRVEHEEATFLLVGDRSDEVLAQTCGINFREVATKQIAFTRVAGVSCVVLPDSIAGRSYRIWVEPSFAVYLWKTLVEICSSLDGQVIGAGCLYPELLR